jgi:lipopolysaccharide export system ATP-binding protein
MMIGLVNADQGVVRLNDQVITHLPMHKRAKLGVAYLPQEASVFRRMTAEENILAVLETRPLSETQRRETLHQLIEEFRLNKFVRQKAYTLSGGERRRVEVARAMALDPSFLLLDEPFAGIDPLAVADIQEVVKQLKKRNIGILITDHNARETLTICDYAYLLAEGKILVEGTPDTIAQDSTAREKYFGEHFHF